MTLEQIYTNPFIWISVVGMVIAFVCRMIIVSSFKKSVGIKSRRAWTANRAAKDALKTLGLEEVQIRIGGNDFSSSYDRRTNSIVMGEHRYNSTDVISIIDALWCVARTEQVARGNFIVSLRNFLMTILRFLGMLSVIAVIVALIFNLVWLYEAVFIVFSAITVLSVLSVFIDMGAARTVRRVVETRGYLSDDEYPLMNNVLRSMLLAYPSTIYAPISQFFKIIATLTGLSRVRGAFREARNEQKKQQGSNQGK
ncbi:zinc metallopeptidase [Eubacteriales bacterium OttesenSCG-928-N14]|nr:zinc metallopeptidase [Eubacteriales bacterium OttesenSCG-928-N14]